MGNLFLHDLVTKKAIQNNPIRTTLDLKTTNTYVTVTGVSSRITVTLSYLKQKKKEEKNTDE